MPDFSDRLGDVYYASSQSDMSEALARVRPALEKLERAIEAERDNDGPFFNGPDLCLVDAAYAPFLQRYALTEPVLETGLLDEYPKVRAWADALLADEAVTGSVAESFVETFRGNLAKRGALAVAG